jgi:aldehyde dehydrogenase (NAD+)/succinate-semialdehyde dehydrogenase/glutarate-semialdehyde dehydrogenase
VASQASWLGFEPPFDLAYDKWADVLVATLKAMRRLRLK